MEGVIQQGVTQSAGISGASRLITEIKKSGKRKYSAEDKIRLVLEGFRKEEPVSEICRRAGIPLTMYYKWLKSFMEGGKARLKGEILREASRDEYQQLKSENKQLKEMIGELTLENTMLKKSLI